MKNAVPIIDVANLRFRYRDGMEALCGIDLTIHHGEKVCLAGPNGAGKSTLFLCLAGLLKAEGKIEIAGRAPDAKTPSPIGLVFQDADDQLFCPTVGDDVAFGPRNQKLPESEVAKRVAESLAATGLSGFEPRSAHHLSGGEKKRAAIAAVLACRPEILAFDEPWANLDARACRAVTRILKDSGQTLLVASQDLYHAADVCKRLIVLDGGKTVADGPMQNLLADKGLLEAHGLDYATRCPHCRQSAA